MAVSPPKTTAELAFVPAPPPSALPVFKLPPAVQEDPFHSSVVPESGSVPPAIRDEVEVPAPIPSRLPVLKAVPAVQEDPL